MNNPQHYIEEYNSLLNDCIRDITDILNTKFGGKYTYIDGESDFVSLRSLFSSPLVAELKSENGNLIYKSGTRGKDKKLIIKSKDFYQFPKQDAIEVYGFLFNKQPSEPPEHIIG